MKIRNGVMAIIINRENKLLLLHRTHLWTGWEFAKGGIENNETELQALEREVLEETGIMEFELIHELDAIIYEHSPEHKNKFTHSSKKVFILRVDNPEITTDDREHDDYKWVSFENALKLLKWEGVKQLLRDVKELL